MAKKITSLEVGAWKRERHFSFFKDFDLPFWNLCAPVDVTALWRHCRRPDGPSFSIAVLHRLLAAVNGVEEFRHRLRRGARGNDGVILHEVIHAGTIVMREDGTFNFAYADFDPDFERFAARAVEAFEQARESPDFDPRDDRDDLIHCSVIPWVAFTSFAHARRLDRGDSVPKIVLGKVHEAPGLDGGTRWQMPVSVEVHHALVDGLHVGRFFERFQGLLAAGES